MKKAQIGDLVQLSTGMVGRVEGVKPSAEFGRDMVQLAGNPLWWACWDLLSRNTPEPYPFNLRETAHRLCDLLDEAAQDLVEQPPRTGLAVSRIEDAAELLAVFLEDWRVAALITSAGPRPGTDRSDREEP